MSCNNYKRFIIFLLSALLSVPFLFVGTSSAAVSSTNVAAMNEESYRILDFLGIIRDTDGGYSENEYITRAQTAAIAGRLLMESGALDKKYKDVSIYTDVPAGTWYTAGVNCVDEFGVMFGYQDKTFKPEQTLSFGEFFTVIIRVLLKKESFTGMNYPYDYQMIAAKFGLTDGMDYLGLNNKLPQSTALEIVARALFVDSDKLEGVGRRPASIARDLFKLRTTTGFVLSTPRVGVSSRTAWIQTDTILLNLLLDSVYVPGEIFNNTTVEIKYIGGDELKAGDRIFSVSSGSMTRILTYDDIDLRQFYSTSANFYINNRPVYNTKEIDELLDPYLNVDYCLVYDNSASKVPRHIFIREYFTYEVTDIDERDIFLTHVTIPKNMIATPIALKAGDIVNVFVDMKTYDDFPNYLLYLSYAESSQGLVTEINGNQCNIGGVKRYISDEADIEIKLNTYYNIYIDPRGRIVQAKESVPQNTSETTGCMLVTNAANIGENIFISGYSYDDRTGSEITLQFNLSDISSEFIENKIFEKEKIIGKLVSYTRPHIDARYCTGLRLQTSTPLLNITKTSKASYSAERRIITIDGVDFYIPQQSSIFVKNNNNRFRYVSGADFTGIPENVEIICVVSENIFMPVIKALYISETVEFNDSYYSKKINVQGFTGYKLAYISGGGSKFIDPDTKSLFAARVNLAIDGKIVTALTKGFFDPANIPSYDSTTYAYVYFFNGRIESITPITPQRLNSILPNMEFIQNVQVLSIGRNTVDVDFGGIKRFSLTLNTNYYLINNGIISQANLTDIKASDKDNSYFISFLKEKNDNEITDIYIQKAPNRFVD